MVLSDYKNRYGLLSIIIGVCLCLPLFSEEKIIVLDNPVIDISESVSIYQNNTNIGIEDILNHKLDFITFSDLPESNENRDLTYWMKLQIKNNSQTDKAYVLDLDKGYTWAVKFYLVSDQNEIITEDSFNINRKHFQRNHLTATLNFPFVIKGKSINVIYFRVKTYNVHKLYPKLYNIESFHKKSLYGNLFIGAMLGILGGLLIYNGFLFLSVKQRAFLYYFLFLIAGIGYIISHYGFGYKLTSLLPVDFQDNLTMVIVNTGLIFLLLFTRYFLNTKQMIGIVNKMISIHIVSILAVTILTITLLAISIPFSGLLIPFTYSYFIEIIVVVLLFSSLITMLTAGIIGIIKHQRNAVFFLIAFIVFIAGSVTSQLHTIGIYIPVYTYFFSIAEQIGIVFSMLLLSIGLTDYISTLRKKTIRTEFQKQKLKEVIDAKTMFFTNITHELRTPLTLIKGPLDEIVRKRFGKNIEYNNEIFKIAIRNCTKLSSLITNLLDLSKIEAGRMLVNKVKIDPGELLNRLTAELHSAAEMKNLQLEFKSRVNKRFYILFDKELFFTAIENLLSNAMKFTSPGGKITVEIDRDNNGLLIKVIDNGIGIPKERLLHVFDRFHSTNNDPDKTGSGTGIGLALVRDIVELHGGKITVHSEPGEGSVFTIELVETDEPVDEIMLQKMEYPVKSVKSEKIVMDSNKKIILIVEDNIDMQRFIGIALKDDFIIKAAGNGKDALSQFEKGLIPDLIISDIMMPEMDGREFFTAVGYIPEISKVPFIFITARTSIDDKITALKEGAVDYIQKPFSLDELENKVRNIIIRESQIKESVKNRIQHKLIDVLGNIDRQDNDAVKISKTRCEQFGITKREYQIIELIEIGFQDKEIAGKLNISVKTVSNHIHRVFKKINVSNRTELIRVLVAN